MNIGLHHLIVLILILHVYDMTHEKKITISLEKGLIGERK